MKHIKLFKQNEAFASPIFNQFVAVNEKISTVEVEVEEYEFNFKNNDFMVNVDVKGTIEYLEDNETEIEVDKISINTLYVGVLDTYLEINPKDKNFKKVLSNLEVILMKDSKFIQEAKEVLLYVQG